MEYAKLNAQGIYEPTNIVSITIDPSHIIIIQTACCKDGWRAMVNIHWHRYVASAPIFKQLSIFKTEEEAILFALALKIKRVDTINLFDDDLKGQLNDLLETLNKEKEMYQDAVNKIIEDEIAKRL